jgi:predicted transcriptional regulator
MRRLRAGDRPKIGSDYGIRIHGFTRNHTGDLIIQQADAPHNLQKYVARQVKYGIKWPARGHRGTGYTTVLKLMQIMSEKGLVERDDAERSHVYKPSLTEEQTQRQLVGHLLDRGFAGSVQKLVMLALAARRVTGKELAEIRKLLDRMEGGSRRTR